MPSLHYSSSWNSVFHTVKLPAYVSPISFITYELLKIRNLYAWYLVDAQKIISWFDEQTNGI